MMYRISGRIPVIETPLTTIVLLDLIHRLQSVQLFSLIVYKMRSQKKNIARRLNAPFDFLLYQSICLHEDQLVREYRMVLSVRNPD